MYDYHYGTSTKKFKQDLDKMKPKLSLQVSQISKIYSHILKFCHGLDSISASQVSKAWYTATWSVTLWQDHCNTLGEFDRIQVLLELAESKFRTFERRAKKQDLEDLFPDLDTKETLKWKLVYGQLLYNTCSHCKIPENKLRFLPILQKSLCFSCAKLPAFAMITLENAEIEYKITRKQINDVQLEGLRVPDPEEPGKFMYVYYISDILHVKSSMELRKREDGLVKTELHERRRTELIYSMKSVGFDDKLQVKYEKWKESDQEDEVLPEPEEILPLKRPRISLSSEEKLKRKIELVDRLLMMGVNSDNIGLEDPDSLASAFIEGRTKEEIGPVAGAIWREHKPVFTGVPFRIVKETTEPSIEVLSSSDSD